MNKISIIIPVYNTEEYLPRCIESVIKQTYKNIEIIVVNDSSLGNCKEIIREYQEKDNRIKLINNEVNKGLFTAREIGVRASEGEYILHVDSDDWINLELCEKLSVELDKNYDFIEFDFTYIFNKPILNSLKDFNLIKYNNKELLTKFETLELQPWFIWRRALKKELAIKIYDKLHINDHLILNEDVLFFMVYIFYVQKAKMINYNGYNYNCNNEMSATREKKKSIERFLINLENYKKIIFYLENFYKKNNRNISHLFAIRQEFFRFFMTQLKSYANQSTYMGQILPKALEIFRADLFSLALFDVRFNPSNPLFLRKLNYIIVRFMDLYIKEDSILYNILKKIWSYIKMILNNIKGFR